MPYVSRGTGEFKKTRIMISGVSNTGKTWSIASFEEEGQSLVCIVCPGEAGVKSLPDDNENFTSYYFEVADDEDISTVQWSKAALNDFYTLYKEVVKNKPDKLFIDGIHHLYSHNFNVITNGEWLAGDDLNCNESGVVVAYRAGGLYNRGHRTFGNWLNEFYTCSVPFVGVTIWEELQDEKDEGDKPGGMKSTRYYQPALPGRMAINVSGRFDARLSARKGMKCIHKGCELTKEYQEHYLWQFASTGDVQGVGIKGLNLTPAMIKTPWIHQSYEALQNLMKRV
jgi:hypothetical protein